LRFEVKYWLEADGLHCQFTATNLGSNAAPYGVGFHPWLSAGGASLDSCEVRLDANEHVLANELLLPVGVEPVSGDFDLRQRRSLKGLDFDDAWLDPVYGSDGRSWCILYCPDGKAPAVWSDHTMPTWQVCSADRIPAHFRFGLAAEPMTCVADAFNTKDLLIELEPGQSHVVNWGATLLNA
jgi:aldose 1-epimerase